MRKIILIAGLVLLVMYGCSGPEMKVSGYATIYGEHEGAYSLDYSESNENFTSIGSWNKGTLDLTESEGILGYWNTSALKDGNKILRIVSDNGMQVEDLFHVLVDNIYITQPSDGDSIDDASSLEIIGSAIGGSFSNFTIDYRHHLQSDWSTKGVSLSDDGLVPVQDSLLATISSGSMPTIGKYYIRLTVFYGDGSNSTETVYVYSLSVDSYELDDSFDNSSQISVDGAVQYRTLYPEHDQDYIRIPVKEGMLYRLNVTYDSLIYMYYYLYDNDYDYADYTSRVDDKVGYETLTLKWTAAEDGFYYLNLHSLYGDVGFYDLAVTEFKDSDGDGSPDSVDCKPNDPDVLTPFEDMVIKDTTVLCPGDFNMTGSLTINGSDMLIQCNGTKMSGDYFSSAFIINPSKNLTISGCSFTGFDIGIETDNYYTKTPVEGLNLINNTFSNMGSAGFVGYFLYDSSVIDNIFNNSKYGLGVYSSDEVYVSNNTFESNHYAALTSIYTRDLFVADNLFSCPTYPSIGIESVEDDSMVVYGDYIEGCKPGVSLSHSSRSMISNNTLNDNLEGVSMDYSYENIIGNNTITDSGASIIARFSHKNHILHNIVSEASSAISLTGSRQNTIFANTFAENDHGLVFKSSSIENVISGNEIYDNGINIEMGQEEDVIVLDTYWGDDDIEEGIYDGHDSADLGYVILERDCSSSLPAEITGSITLCNDDYELLDDVVFAKDSIILDCQGSTLKGPADLIVQEMEQVQISDCILEDVNILVEDSQQISILENTFLGSALRLYYVRDSTIQFNSFTDSVTALVMRKSPENTIKGNSFHNNTIAFIADSALWSEIVSNRFIANPVNLWLQNTERFNVLGNIFIGGKGVVLTSGRVADGARTIDRNVFRQVDFAIRNEQNLTVYAPLNDFGVYTYEEVEDLIYHERDSPELGLVNFTYSITSTDNISLCVDSDKGYDYFKEGYVMKDGETFSDHCEGGSLIEMACNGIELTSRSIECDCLDGACVEFEVNATCHDTDGQDYNAKGTLTYGNLTMVDYCVSDVVMEYSCTDANFTVSDYSCEHGCFDGACQPELVQNDTFCIDSDGGLMYFIAGEVETLQGTQDDYCSGDLLIELYCEDSFAKEKEFNCPEGCTEGRCDEVGSEIEGVIKIAGDDLGLDNFDSFGSSVASYDLDDDGINDLLVGSSYDDGTGSVWEVHLNPNGSVKDKLKIQVNLSKGDFFGSDVDVIDIDSDGIIESLVGADGDDTRGKNRGAFWILDRESSVKISDSSFGGKIKDDDAFGSSVAAIGDLDGDKVPDIAVGSPKADEGGFNRGALWILFMNADKSVKSYTKISDEGLLEGEIDNSDFFGSSVTAIDDLDGDGINDLVVGAYGDDDRGREAGAVYVLFMSKDGTAKSFNKISGITESSSFFGRSVASVNDQNGDGVEDIVVGAHSSDITGRNRGDVWLLHLTESGTVSTSSRINVDLDDNDNFGISVSKVDDKLIAVGAVGDDDGGTNRGAVYLVPLDELETAALTQRETSDRSERISLWQPKKPEDVAVVTTESFDIQGEEYESDAQENNFSLVMFAIVIGMVLAFFVGGIVQIERTHGSIIGNLKTPDESAMPYSAIDVQAIAYVTSMLKANYTPQQISLALRMQNWPPEHTRELINEAMRNLNK